jgi:hypothetical protein
MKSLDGGVQPLQQETSQEEPDLRELDSLAGAW